jgi:hypothetical protein
MAAAVVFGLGMAAPGTASACVNDAECSDGNGCNGVELCIASVCQAGSCGSTTLLNNTFGSGAGTFTYADDTFRGTANGGFASGAWNAAYGQTGGGVRVFLSESSAAKSGGWSATFNLAAANTVNIQFAYRLTMEDDVTTAQFGEILLEVDNVLHGISPNDWILHTAGNGGGAPGTDSGWLTANVNVALAAGNHTITVGSYNNTNPSGGTSTTNDRQITGFFDNVLVTTNTVCGCDNGDVCDGAETCSGPTCVPGSSLDCDDGVACTADSCDSVNGCENVDSCTSGQVCNLTSGLCETQTTVSFQDGVSSYTGTQDTYIQQSVPAQVNGALTEFQWDLQDPTGQALPNWGLIKFANIFGGSAGQIPPGATILSATLRLVVTDESNAPAGSVHNSNVDWDETTANYNNHGGTAGVQAGEIGAFVNPAPLVLPVCDDTQIPPCAVPVDVDVTSSVAAWSANPATNFGWIFVGNSTNGLEVSASEWPTSGQRPKLTVEFVAPGCSTNEQCDDGLYCNGAEQCVSGSCQAGTAPNCDDGVSCTIDSCNEGTDSCDHTANNGACDDGLYCNGAETCNVTLGCQAGTAPNCNDGVACTIDSCNEAMDVCENTPDNGACDDGLFCNGTSTCHPTLGCQAGAPPDCNDGVACTTDACNEGTDTCDHTPNNGACDNGLFCDGAETCHVTLGCQAGTAPNCNDGVGCTVDACNEGTDSCDNTPDDDACDNGLFCDGAEVCHPISDCQAGTPVACSDGVFCTVDACNEATDSCDHVVNNGLCDNGLFCDGAETCNATLGCQGGTAPNCSDGVTCTSDSCNEGTDSCDHTPNNGACDNGLFCDGSETCHVTLGCQAGIAPNCSDGVACTGDSCNEGTDSCDHTPNNGACDNGLFCDGSETCHVTLGCQAGIAPNCGDGVACTSDSCNEGTDSCDHTPNNGACDNGLFCDGSETCHVTLGCQGGTAPDCNDGVGCTGDLCNEGTDACEHVPSNLACDDGLYCNGAETCHPTLDCQAGTAPDCNDGVSCTVDACNEGTDSCDNTPNNGACDDGLFCTGAEVCHPTLGCQAGGGDPCTTPLVCDEGGDACVGCVDAEDCDDGLFCNGAEQCVGNVCQAGTAPDCSDGVTCTGDSCNEGTDACDHAPNDAACDNGLFCDGSETCHVTLGCQAGTAPNCDDGVGCTGDLCNEGADTCEHVPSNLACDDGLYCNGPETCDLVLDCQPGEGVGCDDDVNCTADVCNEATDSCDNTPDDGECTDGLFCNGAEVCHATLGCQPPTNPTPCNDANVCTTDSCDEGLDTCSNVPLPDGDLDTVCDAIDNCPTISNLNQLDTDVDSLGNACDNCDTVKNGPAESAVTGVGNQTDTDGDLIGDGCDSCRNNSNPTITPAAFQTTTGGQLDDDGDGFGQRCDADFNNDGPIVNASDFSLFKLSFGKNRKNAECGLAGTDPCDHYDLDGAGPVINSSDFTIFKTLFGQKRGPKCPQCGPPFPDPNLPCAGDKCF